MCGIAGYIGDQKIESSVISKTLTLMKNRGPDYKNFYQTEINKAQFLLLHSRLSIIDLESRSNQPFFKDDLVIVFNGEIYNYLELKKKLINLGCNFFTNSDTEVIVESYRKFGENCIKNFEGMWSFVLLDLKKKKIFMSRDRFGEKPFYYYNTQKNIFFGSEPKFIFSLLGRKLKVNSKKLSEYLVLGYRSIFKERETFYENLHELDPGTNLMLDSELNKEKKKYWQLKFQPIKLSEEDVYEESKRLIQKSMNLRLRSDVPIAFCLSGGIDSSSLAAITSVSLNKKIHTFSVIDSDPRYNEKKEIEEITNHLRCQYTLIESNTGNFIERMEKIINYYQAPIPTISYYVHNLLSEKIKENGFKVAISGTGADEIFTGYYDHYSFWLKEMQEEENFKQLLKDRDSGYAKYVNNPLLKDPFKIINNENFRDHLNEGAESFNDLLKKKINYTFHEEFFSDDVLRNRMLNELLHEIVPVILFSDDLNSMMYSVENRSPFLDSCLVEFLYSVPTKYLIRDGFQKIILRNSVKGMLPDSILFNKKKVGFNASIKSLFDYKLPKNRDWLMSDHIIFDIIDREKFEKFLDKDYTKNFLSKFLFNFISSKIFLSNYKSTLN